MTTNLSKLSKPLKVALLAAGLATASLPAMAQHYHGGGGYGYHGGGHYYHGGGHYRGNNWLGAAIVTGVVGGLVYGAVNNQPTYYSAPPVMYSQPYPVYSYPTYVAPPVRTYTWDPYLGRYVITYR